jgi:hypothetical protein
MKKQTIETKKQIIETKNDNKIEIKNKIKEGESESI